MEISIITPTILRPSLKRACDSVSNQTSNQWQHIIFIDRPIETEEQEKLIENIKHPQRTIIYGTIPHNNFGNTPRHLAWFSASNKDWVFYLDCDNYLADDSILSDMDKVLSDEDNWAIFPILRHGYRFFMDPPGLCRTDTANMVIKWDIGQWPDVNDYTADGILCERLKAYEWESFPNFRPIVVMERSNLGQ